MIMVVTQNVELRLASLEEYLLEMAGNLQVILEGCTWTATVWSAEGIELMSTQGDTLMDVLDKMNMACADEMENSQ